MCRPEKKYTHFVGRKKGKSTLLTTLAFSFCKPVNVLNFSISYKRKEKHYINNYTALQYKLYSTSGIFVAHFANQTLSARET